MTIHQVGSLAKPRTLRVVPRGSALVPDYEAQRHPTHPVRRFHGWTHDASLGEAVQEQDGQGRWSPNGKLSGGFRRLDDEIVEVPDTPEYRRHIVGDPRSPKLGGDLLAADIETARAVGVRFDLQAIAEHHPKLATQLGWAPKADAHVGVGRPDQGSTSRP